MTSIKGIVLFSMAVIGGLFHQVVVGLQLGVQGIQNCPNKCSRLFDAYQYAISDQPGQTTFEFRSCIIGCTHCGEELTQPNLQEDTCFDFCKTFDYTGQGIRKGVIEPDKACIMGCVINTCQKVCFGGTTDTTVTPRNRRFFWNQGGDGCSIKGGNGYVQSPLYIFPDAPAGAGATTEQRLCCSNALNLCNYVGDRDSTNFANVLASAQQSCQGFASGTTQDAICNYFGTPQNCGTPGMPFLMAAGSQEQALMEYETPPTTLSDALEASLTSDESVVSDVVSTEELASS